MKEFLMSLSCSALLACSGIAQAIESLAFEVLETHGDIEIRQYAPHLLATVRVEGEFDEAGSQAFRPLFNYISGDNRSDEKIAMTAPVVLNEQVLRTSLKVRAPPCATILMTLMRPFWVPLPRWRLKLERDLTVDENASAFDLEMTPVWLPSMLVAGTGLRLRKLFEGCTMRFVPLRWR